MTLSVAEYCYQGFVVDTEEQVLQTQYKDFAFFQARDGGESLALDRMVSRLSWGAESTATVHCLPALGTTAWHLCLRTLTMFLCQPIPYSQFSLICCKSCWQGWVKAPDTLFTLTQDLLF